MGECPDQSVPPKCGMLEVLRNPYFSKGYNSFLKGRVHNTSAFSQQKVWFYERGQHLAGEALEKFGHVPKLRLVRHIDKPEDGFVINPKIIDLAWSMLVNV